MPTLGAAMFVAGCGGGGLFGGGGGSFTAALTQDDWVIGNGFYADRYLFRVRDTGNVVIDMESTYFDTYLIVIDEQNNVLEDDDSGPGSDARLSFQGFEGELLEVRATSYDPGVTGPYRLKWSNRLEFEDEILSRGAKAEALPGPSKRKS